MQISKLLILVTSAFFLNIGEAQSLNDALNSVSKPEKRPPKTSSSENLTGDTRLACEAILCLSSAHRPNECNPSIDRYFSIHHKKLKDTLNARRSFLNQCPASNEKNMPSLVNAIVGGAGRCDAAELNRVMRYTVQETICPKNKNRYGNNKDENNCYIVTKTYIKPSKPSYCKIYFDHEWTTAGDKVKYIGTEKDGGRWVNVNK